MADNNLMTIDTSIVAIYEQEGDKFILNPEAESVIEKWLHFKAQIEEIDKAIQNRLTEKMQQDNILKIEGEHVKVLRMSFGEKYEIVDKEIALDMGFAKEEVKVKADSKEIERYIKDTGELPDCVKLRERTDRASIREVK